MVCTNALLVNGERNFIPKVKKVRQLSPELVKVCRAVTLSCHAIASLLCGRGKGLPGLLGIN